MSGTWYEPARATPSPSYARGPATPTAWWRAPSRGWENRAIRDRRFAVAASVCEVLARKTTLSTLTDSRALRSYLSAVLADAQDAPRTASRLASYRRVLTALPRAIASTVAQTGGSGAGAEVAHAWLTDECHRANHPPVREALSEAIAELRGAAHGQTAGAITTWRAALQSSAKPPRDPTRIRPGLGRGKRSRPIR